jgi:3-deoxy-D-manno-octulosonic-acid transferase
LLNTRPPLFYRLIQLLTAPAIALFFASRWLTNRSYRPNFLERFGLLPKSFSRTKPGSIWLHAVSVGEVASAVPLLQEIRKTFPGAPLYLSVSTVAGRQTAQRQAASLVDGLFYAPIDYASFVRRTLAAIRPALLIVLETEIWPNLYFETVRTGARLVVVNGRISNRTWPQYQALRWFFCKVLQWPDLVLVQSPTDLERYRLLGVPQDRIAVAGNLKYDAACSANPISIDTFGAEKIWIAASTVGPNERASIVRHFIDEDDIVLDAFTALAREFPKLLLLLAPRQPDRFAEVAGKLQARGLAYLLRSNMGATLTLPGVLLLDTIGELAGLYHAADVVFVGGSIAPRGGHNILEPAAAGASVVTGTHMQNFESIARDFAAARAFVQVADGSALRTAVVRLLKDAQLAVDLGQRARALVECNRGVSKAVVQRLEPLYYSASLRRPRSSVARFFLAPLAFLWKQGGRIRRDRSEQRAASLLPVPVPVVSIGGITVGGSGKTPFANYLAGVLRARGLSPAILTRGYKRRYPAEQLIFAPGAKVSPFFTGDEAQIFLRAAHAPVGIGARRYETAQIMLRQFPETDVMLLDDGFQHALMPRNLDIVLIDGLDPFGQEELVPLGRLREPLTALERADCFVVTRADNDKKYAAIRTRLASYNARAPVFRTRLNTRDWRDCQTGDRLPPLTGKKVGAFCGLGNPQNFWDTLRSMGLNVVFRWAFADHHLYKPAELSRIAHQARMHGATILVTTEKDRINCPGHLHNAIGSLPLAWLEIELELEDEAGFLDYLLPYLRRSP